MTFEVTVTKRGGEPIPMALVIANDEATGKSFSRGTDGNGYANVALFDVPVGTPITLSVQAGGYLNAIQYPTTTVENQSIPIVLASFKQPVAVVVRPPLPAFDPHSTDPSTGAPLPVHTTLTMRPPVGFDVSFMRANLWGLTVPDLEAIPGGAVGAAQGRMLTYLFNRYRRASQEQGVTRYASYGYSHWWMSWPDARATGQSIDEYVSDCLRIRQMGVPFIGHLLRSKDFDAANPDPNGINDVLGALVQSKAIDHAAPAWEASLFNSPEHYMQMVEHDAAILLPHGVVMGHHLQAGYAHFGPNITDGDPTSRGLRSARAFWLKSLELGVKRLYWQADPAWTAGMMQARGTDVSVRAIAGGAWGLPESFDWDAFELCGVPLFNNGQTGDGRLATEDTADLLNYEIGCTPGPRPPSGYGNGARRPDGTML